MNIRTYTAKTMDDALRLVRQDLGQHAVVLHTRTYKQGGLMGFGAKTVVEISAADGRQIGRDGRRGGVSGGGGGGRGRGSRRSVTTLSQSSGASSGASNELGELSELGGASLGADSYQRSVTSRGLVGEGGMDSTAAHGRGGDRGGNQGRDLGAVRAGASGGSRRKTAADAYGTTSLPQGLQNLGSARSDAEGGAGGDAGDLIRRTYAVALKEMARRQKQAESNPTGRLDGVLESGLKDGCLTGELAPLGSYQGQVISRERDQREGSLGQGAGYSSREAKQAVGRGEQPNSVANAKVGSDSSRDVLSTAGFRNIAAGISVDALADDMEQVKRLLSRMVMQQTDGGLACEHKLAEAQTGSQLAARLPDGLFDCYQALLNQDLDADLAKQAVEAVADMLDPSQLDHAKSCEKSVVRALARLVPTRRGEVKTVGANTQTNTVETTSTSRQGPKKIALVGPTGVGKTTTIAKLAATHKLRFGHHVGLITLDTYRIAAVEQLKVYAKIIGLPLHVVATPDEMARSVNMLSGCDVILIDTAGRSQRNDDRLTELESFLEAAEPDETYLVLSATSSKRVMDQIADRFQAVHPSRLIFTKLDEAAAYGPLLSMTCQTKLPVSYLTTGQEVPHQIEPCQPERLAQLAMDGQLTAVSPNYPIPQVSRGESSEASPVLQDNQQSTANQANIAGNVQPEPVQSTADFPKPTKQIQARVRDETQGTEASVDGSQSGRHESGPHEAQRHQAAAHLTVIPGSCDQPPEAVKNLEPLGSCKSGR